MKAKVNYTSKGENDAITVSMKRQVPWWLLILLPLILLIPIKRDLLNQIMEGENGIPMSQTPVSFSYNDVGIFGARTPQQGTDQTDNEGKFAVKDVSEPLWYYLFVDSDTLHITTNNDCPKLTNYMAQYKEYSRGEYKVIAADAKIIDATFTVIDKKTHEPLPDATVTVEIIHNGESTTKEFSSDANGKVTVPGLSSCDKINVKGEKEKYSPDFINNLPVTDIPGLSNDDKTLELMPLKGQNGALRINLQWYCTADLDLMVIDPCGNVIALDTVKKETCNGGIGRLDVDANFHGTPTDQPQENIFWDKAPQGSYKIYVVGWAKDKGKYNFPLEYNVSVIDTQNRKRMDKRGTISEDILLPKTRIDLPADLPPYFLFEYVIP